MSRKASIGRRSAVARRRKAVRAAAKAVRSDATPGTEFAPIDVSTTNFVIAGIGASAGGLEVFSQILHGLPADAGLALVLIQHLAPQHESVLPDLLASASHMPVVKITDGMTVQPNHVYVMPPNTQLELHQQKLRLHPRPDNQQQFMPIDIFLRSLAESAQNHAVAVVLSGTASDGSSGLREVKAAGGITLVQDPKTARFDGMPRSAIATGAVDLVLSPTEIAAELVRITRHPLIHTAGPVAVEPPPLREDQDLMNRVFSMLRSASGVDFTHYKRPTIQRRLQRRVVVHKLTSLREYVDFLHKHPEEITALYQDLLIHVTRFFREPESFELLSSEIFSSILQRRQGEEPVRIWVPGCSTGEEPYSIAMTLLEVLGDQAASVPVQLFATDVSELAIEQARAGEYPHSIAADVSAERLRRFFTRTDNAFRISKPVRDLCIFARQDLTRDPPFSRLDLIVCRNVLIYLGPSIQKRLMSIFHYALKPGSFLILGNAETVGPHTDMFSPLDRRRKAYVKKPASARMEMDFPAIEQLHRLPAPHLRTPAESRVTATVQTEANRLILNHYAPPGVIVDDDLQIVQFRGQTGRYLEPSPGEASLNLLKMAREGLLYGLRTAIHEARTTDAAVRKDGLRVRQDSGMQDVNLVVIPLTGSEGRHFLVLFETTSAPPVASPPPRKSKRSSGEESSKVKRLQQELAATRAHLETIIQDLEAANEELQSANEEILSANEELQSTNEELDTAREELQSTNEELNTVNEELHGRNEELSRVNSDLMNLLASVQLAIVMVSGDLRIRRFTPVAEKVLNLIPGDIGRPINDIKPKIDCPDLGELIREAIDNVRVQERSVRDADGRCYSLYVRPYKNVDNKIDGAVLALIDRP